jgi:hypothetical protein
MSLRVFPGKTLAHHLPAKGGTQVSCRGCRIWFDGKSGVCPECGWHRPAFNKWLRTAKLNGQLVNQVANDHSNVSFVKKANSEKPPR